MRVSINWLREYVDFDLTAVELAEKLTMAGFEVEDIEDRRTWADGVVVGRVLECVPHPQADRLRVCQVDTGSGRLLNIVCGAPNARADIYVPVATVGTYLPIKDLKLRSTTIRGVPSEGMLCSLAELGLEKESDGIYIFSQSDLPLGADVRPLLKLDDVILDIASTANRADALSIIGIAREVAALTGGLLRLPIAHPPAVGEGALAVRVEAPDACPIYTATLLEGLRVGPAPAWLVERLEKAGMRSINNLVDITNYVLLEWGQPLHAFDADKLAARPLGVRFARKGEHLRTLDGTDRSLEPVNLLITAADGPVAVAGVMGGEATEVSPETTSVVLEAAVFDPVVTRRSARALGLRSEASARYERGVDSFALEHALGRALQLLIDFAGARVSAQAIVDGRERQGRTLVLRPERLARLLGEEIPAAQIAQVLKDLGFDVQANPEHLRVSVPSHRLRDIEREVDLIEEVARIVGYERFAPTLPPPADGGYLPFEDQLERQIRAICQGAGLTEVVTYSLAPDRDQNPVALSNPLSAELNSLRTNLIDGLIETLRFNRSQGTAQLHAFEIGIVFLKTDEGIFESQRLAAVLCGAPTVGDWQKKAPDFDWFAAKGVLASLFSPWQIDVEYQADRQDDRLHPGRTASLWIDGERLGVIGQLHPRLAARLDLPEQTFFFEIDLDFLIAVVRERPAEFRPYSPYPASDRDLSFYAREGTTVFEFERVIRDNGEPLLESVALIDEYRGSSVPEGSRSLAFRMVYRSDHTLTEEEVNSVHQRIRQALIDRFDIEARS
ncbi:phenylalanine--tRNA ligase subunit beta [Gloeobacter kilaueensis]|uniref:Phenylalanine--tRNA ligase beta subunit n=1 Tax=Gloeobacter kilaueensis (strain ATCC BAA-2537 / CCAP 1431/1 / ULC 316 / JS1) TaxID=1183438 RepID=U5QP85_GLOK1|nr:phenylalanine--tRNA ligase subunit beta [Gloeobacter kilaueensis]AGY59384.1 phenylalanyl-tRNA synthetase subunit beta [Gloeobacter kilaueensis JS1]